MEEEEELENSGGGTTEETCSHERHSTGSRSQVTWGPGS